MNKVKGFFGKIGNWFREIGVALAHGDAFTRLSLLVMGAQNFRSKQFIRGIILTVCEAVVIVYTALVGGTYLAKLTTLGTVEREVVFNLQTMKNETNDYDHSFRILLFGIISLIILVVFILFWLNNLRTAYRLQQDREAEKHVPTFREELKSLVNEKFYRTLLFFPCAGVLIFTIVPLIVMIAVAFTNYDKQHLPPSALLSWVGFENFKNLFSVGGSTFGYSFRVILVWTLVWAVFATFTTYIGGILLSMLINGPKIRLKRLWRTIFIIAIAVPQFVTLLLVSKFFADAGIVNTICSNLGITDFLKKIGLLGQSMTYIPFLSKPGWARVTIIVINIWVGVPYLMLIATGVLMNIPADLTEAARIDGANKFQSFCHITMPYMFAVTGPYVVTQFVNNINNFNVIYLLTESSYTTTNQALANSSAKEVDLLVTWLFRLTQDEYNYKMASVIGIMVFVICALFTLVAFNRVTGGGKEDDFN